MRKLVGRNVRVARVERGMTQERLADVSGFSQQYISDLERGRRNPTIVSLYELAQALSVTPIELLTPWGQGTASQFDRYGPPAKECDPEPHGSRWILA